MKRLNKVITLSWAIIACLIMLLATAALADATPKSYQELRRETVKEIEQSLQKYTEKPPVQKFVVPQPPTQSEQSAPQPTKPWQPTHPWSDKAPNPWSTQEPRQKKPEQDKQQPSTRPSRPNIFLPSEHKEKPQEPATNIYQ